MVLDLSVATVTSFLTVIVLLAIYSYLDFRDRKVKNEVVLAGVVVGCVVSLLTGHFVYYLDLHLIALIMMIPIVLILFNIGAIGGADAKVLILVTIISPGIELGVWNDIFLESLMGLNGYLIIMLVGGYIYWRVKKRVENADPNPPLIPLLLIGYVVIQILALF